MIDMETILSYTPFWAFCAIFADVITGYYQAWVNFEISSKAMKAGAKRKGAEGLLILMIIIVNQALTHYSTIQIPTEYMNLISVISTDGVCAFIILKELTSVCENLGKANPDLLNLPFMTHMLSNKELYEHIQEIEQLKQIAEEFKEHERQEQESKHDELPRN